MEQINKSELTNSQLESTTQTQYLQHEFPVHLANAKFTPAKLAQIFKRAEEGWILEQCDLFADMEERDGHIAAELGKRKRALLCLEWEVKDPHNATAQEKTLAENIRELFLEFNDFEDVLLAMSNSISYGFSCLEIEWEFKNNVWFPKELVQRPNRWFQLSMFDRDEIKLRDGSSDGAELWKAGWLVHKQGSGDVSRLGINRSLAFPYLFKHYALNDFNEFLEIFGLPLIVGKYPLGASKEDQNVLRRAIQSIGHSAKGIMPETMMIEFQEASKASGDPFKQMIEWCENTASKIILGGTLTSQSTGSTSTNALGNVHNEVRRDLLISDAVQIGSSLSRLIALICEVNGWQGRPPRFVFDTVEPDDLALFADAIPKLAAAGMDIPLSFLHGRLKIPAPVDGEPVLKVQQAQPVGAAMTALSNTVNAPKFTPQQQAIEGIADNLLDNVNAPLSNEQLHSVIRAAKSPQDLENRLAVLMNGENMADFTVTLERALFAADVWGYANA